MYIKREVLMAVIPFNYISMINTTQFLWPKYVIPIYFYNLPRSKNKLFSKGYPNRLRNGQEKGVQTNKQTYKQTDRHFRIYIVSREDIIGVTKLVLSNSVRPTDGSVSRDV